jgi:UDP-arabinose 4-epimerase
MTTVLVTGGAGYVGSHCCKAFARAGWTVVTYDNLSRGLRGAVRWGPLVEGDIADAPLLGRTLREVRPDLVAHFAAYAYVGESVEQPDIYYRNNVLGTLALLDAMRDAGVMNLIFSSSCATYGLPLRPLIDEQHPQQPINPYGWSKLFCERMVADYGAAFGLNAVMLRYFNAAGCDPDGEIGENHDPETHAIPLAIAAALGEGQTFTINGTDFETRDGTAVRDYVHVADLARAHLLAGERLLRQGGVHRYNLGTGIGSTVAELVDAVGVAVGRPVPSRSGPRRSGDPAALVASADLARHELGWSPEMSDLAYIVRTALDWQLAKTPVRGQALLKEA